MKLMQQDVTFSPIALVVETEDEAKALWELARFATTPGALTPEAAKIAIKISDWFSNEAHL